VRISSGNVPLIAPNPNTGRNALVADHVPQVATHTVLHAKNWPSSIFLPVMPGPASPGQSNHRPFGRKEI